LQTFLAAVSSKAPPRSGPELLWRCRLARLLLLYRAGWAAHQSCAAIGSTCG